jgi:hypothetical protein
VDKYDGTPNTLRNSNLVRIARTNGGNLLTDDTSLGTSPQKQQHCQLAKKQLLPIHKYEGRQVDPIYPKFLCWIGAYNFLTVY